LGLLSCAGSLELPADLCTCLCEAGVAGGRRRREEARRAAFRLSLEGFFYFLVRREGGSLGLGLCTCAPVRRYSGVCAARGGGGKRERVETRRSIFARKRAGLWAEADWGEERRWTAARRSRAADARGAGTAIASQCPSVLGRSRRARAPLGCGQRGEGKGRTHLVCMGGGAGARSWVECGAVMPGMGERKRAFREHNRQEQRRKSVRTVR
jgi:hypothetical protein